MENLYKITKETVTSDINVGYIGMLILIVVLAGIFLIEWKNFKAIDGETYYQIVELKGNRNIFASAFFDDLYKSPRKTKNMIVYLLTGLSFVLIGFGISASNIFTLFSGFSEMLLNGVKWFSKLSGYDVTSTFTQLFGFTDIPVIMFLVFITGIIVVLIRGKIFKKYINIYESNEVENKKPAVLKMYEKVSFSYDMLFYSFVFFAISIPVGIIVNMFK